MGPMSAPPGDAAKGPVKRLIKSPRELLAGLLLLGLAAAGFFGAIHLNAGQLSSMGPGMMPKLTSIALAIFAVVLAAQSLTAEGPSVPLWNGRGIVFVLGAVLVFAAAIRGLGLGVAGPLAVIVSALADRETRLVEIVPFALAMTLFSALLFKWVLGLAIPVLPFLLGY
jgi:putative tricarboxylic transport membrane protein